MKIVCISDTHTQQNQVILPEGDILIHSGDFDIRSELDLIRIVAWFKKLSLTYNFIIFIAGNHDFYLEELFRLDIIPDMPRNIYYLSNNFVEIEGIKIWGSPFSPQFGRWAFMGHHDELKEIWDTIPSDTDIVITHCPAFGILDQLQQSFISVGCPALRDKLKEIKPKYHICGHIHEAYGIYQDEHTTYINASLLDEYYAMVNKPVEIEYDTTIKR